MDSWIWQRGYPLITASLDPNGRLHLRQQRFSFDADVADDTVWMVPLSIRTASGTERILMTERDLECDVDTSGPVVVNAGGDGFLRVAYDATLLGRIGAALHELSVLERYCLVDDAVAALHAGRIDALGLLDLLGSFAAEDSLPVWQAIVGGLRVLRRMAASESTRSALAARVRDLCIPALERLADPVAGEPELTGTLRGLLLRTAATVGRHQESIARCRSIMEAARSGATTDPELLAAATTVVAATGDSSDYEQMLAGYRHGTTPQEQLRYLYALAEFDDRALVLRTCELAMSDDVKTQNAPFLLRACIANLDHGATAWDFVSRHWADANRRFPTNTIVRMIDSVKLLTDDDEVRLVQSFFAEHPIPQAEATLRQVLERQIVNARCVAGQRSVLDALVD